MSSQTIIIQGSSRSNGNTAQIIEHLIQQSGAALIDLNTKVIHPYDYEYRHLDDDFIPSIETILEYDNLVFATPVYWYSMSGIMKNFFDRITDLLKKRKDLGYQLKGKTMYVVSCGSEEELVPEFIAAFKYSAEYLGMNFGYHLHTWIEEQKIPEKVELALMEFAQLVK